ncbi:MAG: hypothetical protein C4326_11715 [Ignavibacteria bacterium]
MKPSLNKLIAFLAGDVGSRAIGFVITAYLARVLDTGGFGVVNIGFSVLGYLMLLGTPGIHLIETRNAAAAEGMHSERVQAILSLRLVLAVALILGAAVLAALLPMEAGSRRVVVLSTFSLVPLALSLDWFFHGKEQFWVMSAAKVLSAATFGTAGFIVVRSAEDVAWVPIAFALGNTAAAIFFLIQYRSQFGPLRLMWRLPLWKQIVGSNVPVGMSVFLAQSTVNLPPIVVGWLVSSAAAGLFSAALKVVFVLLMIDRVVHALLLPVTSRAFTGRGENAAVLLVTVTKGILVLLFPLTTCAVLLASPAVTLIFGEQYAAAAPVLQILLAYFLLTVLNTVLVCALIGSGREKAYTLAVTIGSALSVLASVFGTLLFGIGGTAWGMVAGELLTVVLMVRAVRRVVGGVIVRALLAPSAAATATTLGLVLMPAQHVAVQCVMAIVLFSVFAFVFRVLKKEERQLLQGRFV